MLMSRYYREHPDEEPLHDVFEGATIVRQGYINAPSRIDEEGRCMALPANEDERCRACGCNPCAPWCGCEEMA
jgi:hypothetical protein